MEQGQKKPRKLFAKQGYYVYQNMLTGDDIDIVYTTGVAGGGGHCYWRKIQGRVPSNVHRNGTLSKFKNGWTTLQWNCVPGKRDIHNYTYYANCPKGFNDWK
jgi:hypothetical protein